MGFDPLIPAERSDRPVTSFRSSRALSVPGSIAGSKGQRWTPAASGAGVTERSLSVTTSSGPYTALDFPLSVIPSKNRECRDPPLMEEGSARTRPRHEMTRRRSGR